MSHHLLDLIVEYIAAREHAGFAEAMGGQSSSRPLDDIRADFDAALAQQFPPR